MLAASIILLIINLILMFLFFSKIKKRFSVESYENLLNERMSAILRDFNFHTDQAVTILEDRINEMKKLMADADKRFIALSKKLESASAQTAKMNEDIVDEVEKLEQNFSSRNIAKAEVYSFNEKGQTDKFIKNKIIEMHKNGWSIEFIADKLSLPIEEVRLIAFMSNAQGSDSQV